MEGERIKAQTHTTAREHRWNLGHSSCR